MGREDFLVSAANQAAVAAVDAWPDWPAPVLIIVGDPGSGKSHLADVWRKMSDALVMPATQLKRDSVLQFAQHGCVAIEDAPGSSLDEVALFHLINLARETSGHILITTGSFPSVWPVTLPDLQSRLKAAQVVQLGDPDDDLLRGLLVKMFADRQLQVDENVISYMIKRMERSFESARWLVQEIDEQALSSRAEITRAFVSKVMQSAAQPGFFDSDSSTA